MTKAANPSWMNCLRVWALAVGGPGKGTSDGQLAAGVTESVSPTAGGGALQWGGAVATPSSIGPKVTVAG